MSDAVEDGVEVVTKRTNCGVNGRCWLKTVGLESECGLEAGANCQNFCNEK